MLYKINCELTYRAYVYIEADSEDEARELFDNQEWDDEEEQELTDWDELDINEWE